MHMNEKQIIGRFERRGYKLTALRQMMPTETLLRKHYADLTTKSFFPGLLSYMLSGPVVGGWPGCLLGVAVLNLSCSGCSCRLRRKSLNGTTQHNLAGMVWEGKDAVKTGRKMLGETNPLASAPGTIRGDYCVEVGRNLCHGSDSVENAELEIALWFPEGANAWSRVTDSLIYE